ncbi:Retrotransposon gag protein [Rhizoctonia solani]|uniref:Retrotransposon gag protein n=1 Tax=Rhizoctonia solani TaxID=456999 RepID=A0A8H7M413_9AGAM|nr:Retrotransposon gag protein [Rhizoctonia solani]
MLGRLRQGSPHLPPLPPAPLLVLPPGIHPRWPVLPHTSYGNPLPATLSSPLPYRSGRAGTLPSPASPELGEISLERVIRLLWGSNPNREVRTNVENISQAVDTVKDGLAQLQQSRVPTPQKNKNPPQSRKLPGPRQSRAFCKTQPSLGAPAPIFSTGAPRRDPLTLFNPYPSSSFPSGPAPAPKDLHQRLSLPRRSLQPLHCKSGPPRCLQRQDRLRGQAMANPHVGLGLPQPEAVPSDLEVLSFLLMNMEEAAGAWAHPHLDQLGSHCALIQTVDEFKVEFLAAFGDPDATRAAERKITSLTQSGTCAKYITKFRTLQMELDWNDAALCGQFARGLHWEVRKQIATRERQPRTLRELQDAALIIDNALREERASHPQQGNKSVKPLPPPTGGQVPANRPPKPALSPPTPITSRRTNVIAAAQKVSVSNAANQAQVCRVPDRMEGDPEGG